jgi:hypothetical protein
LIKAGTPLQSLAPLGGGRALRRRRSDQRPRTARGRSATNALRGELAPQGTGVTGVIVGLIDTAMSAAWDLPKVTPANVVAVSYDGVARGDFEVLADDESQRVKALLGGRSEGPQRLSRGMAGRRRIVIVRWFSHD